MNDKGQLSQSPGMSQVASLPVSHSLPPTLKPSTLKPKKKEEGGYL